MQIVVIKYFNMDKKLYSLLLAFFLLLSFSSCNRDKSISLQEFPDPYLASFKNKGIQYLLRFDANFPEEIDTTAFDKEGNVIWVKEVWSRDQYRYDSLGFLNRYLSISDVIQNYSINYKIIGDTLIQTWTEIIHRNWDYDLNDLNENGKIVIKFKLDKAGKVISEVDEFGKTSSIYVYDKSYRLIRAETFSFDGELIRKTNYRYINEVLSEIELIANNKVLFTHYFSGKGLLDSTVNVKGDFIYTVNYSYVYY
jgi:hypothetical protein